MDLHTLGTHINHDDWHKTTEGKDYFASILRHGKRRVFGTYVREKLEDIVHNATLVHLAAIHFNWNADLPQATTKSGKKVYKLRKLKYKLTRASVTEVKGPGDYGCLESPMLASHLEQPKIMKYKLCLVGKTGVGKTSTVAKLSGHQVPMTHAETPGIITSITFWPAKLKHSGKPVMFRLQFWDAGHAVQRKFDHIHPACREKAQAVLYFFSFIDRSSFEDLRTQLSKSLTSEDTPLIIVIGTKYDQYNRSEITSRELLDFQKQWQVPILKLKNVLKPTDTNALLAGDSCAEIDDIAPAMNTLVEYLWIHDQVLSGNIELSPSPKVNTSRGLETHDGDSDGDEATYV